MSKFTNKSIYAKINDTDWEAVHMDKTHSLSTIEFEHHEIHEGNHYFIAGYDTLASAATIKFVVTTPASGTIEAHMTFGITGSSVFEMGVYEGLSGYLGGTALTAINNDRNSTNTSELTVVLDPSGLTYSGTLIDSFKVGSSDKKNPQIGEGTRDRELILKFGTIYLFEITSGAADNVISYKGNWYENAV